MECAVSKINFKEMHPDTACWRITSRCNRECSFCYRPETRDLKTKEIKKIIDSLSLIKVKCLGITGGEPLTREDISQILGYAKSKKFMICLATNADFFKKYRKDIFRCVKAIGLPIESTDSKIHDSLRGKGNLKSIKLAIKDILDNSNLVMYFTTVLTRKNRGEMEKIEKFLSSFKDRVVYWKIYEIVEYNDRKHQSVKNLRTSIDEGFIKHLGKFLGKDRVFYLPALKRQRSYFLINPNGDVIIPRERESKTEDMIIGNILRDDYKKILSKWREETNLKDYKCHLCALKFKS